MLRSMVRTNAGSKIPIFVIVCALAGGIAARTQNNTIVKETQRRGFMPELQSRPLFSISMSLDPVMEVGDTPAGHRRVFTVSGGHFNGDRLKGVVLPQASSDLLLIRADGSAQQDARIVLKTDDGAIIVMTYRGVRHASADVNAKIARGEHVDGSEYYLRTVPFFETSAPKYAWLNQIVAVSVGERQPNGVSYQVFEIL